ncbi:HRDC domain-containing protein [Corynebacterium otitidis]|uniref:Ribonuclease D n=1 Tax=Corynebacterium otitidis ATCC 51513 TaxID=883169 RepID=I7L8F2_9CORY|nr:HRDC domain-containing protein [Corynebacterium otitidis]EJZ83031.1 ribonuclease D [Corynebacterium otitidis ATCC 51513]KKO83668.1 ribonuclease D [Corynebacterium otitidis]CCI83192.1 ribonuclease D [Corynebacterium otitidis ATCC 51513]
MPRTLTSPADGRPALRQTPDEFQAAAEALAEGRGPFAIDTERASSFRYDDRVFLLQVRRRGAGTFLFAPEGARRELTAALKPVLGGEDWVLHAAGTDLGPLSWLGLEPGRLFDTELAGRLAGFDRVNLAAMLERVFDVTLLKGHGAEDWSTAPLPAEWLDYAALDVELLLELAEALTEILDSQGKLEWAEEDFRALAAEHRSEPRPERRWDRVKSIGKLRSPRQLAVARGLFEWREDRARKEDLSPHLVMRDRALLALAENPPRSPAEVRRAPYMGSRQRGLEREIMDAVTKALKSPRSRWPRRLEPRHEHPPHQSWPSRYPKAAAALEAIRGRLDTLSERIDVPRENIVQPSALRAVVWDATERGTVHSTRDLQLDLSERGARPWQRELVVPLMAGLY